VLLYGLKNCDTCRKALKSLPQADLRDVRKDGVPEAVLAAALEKFGDALLNTRSTTWRGLSEAQRQAAPMDLLKAHPALMKRPLIDVNNTLFLGWNNAVEMEIKASL
jgi:arsenate reductase